MDLVDWNKERFLEIRDEFEDFIPKLDVFRDVKFMPNQRAQRRQRRRAVPAHAVV